MQREEQQTAKEPDTALAKANGSSSALRGGRAQAGTALTDGERIDRILKRCEGEDLEVSREEASEALEVEKGHVGKALIRLRKLRRQADSMASLKGPPLEVLTE